MSDVLVLCLHAVSPRWPADLSITPASLERTLTRLQAQGYRGTTFYEAAVSPPAPKTLAVTFDDSYRSVIELAFPVLERLSLPGTVFVPTDYVGQERPMVWPGIDRWLGGPYEEELVPMSWDELRRLDRAGWEIGSHTRSHPKLTQIADFELREELEGSRRACEVGLGKPCATVAYPYGDLDARVAAAARAAGYTAGAALPRRFDSHDRMTVPRIGVYHYEGDRRIRLKTSRVLRELRRSALWTGIDRARAGRRALARRNPPRSVT